MSIEPEEEIIGRTTNYFKLFMYVITKLGIFIAYTSNWLPYLHLQ
jgi:hypothetical protein